MSFSLSQVNFCSFLGVGELFHRTEEERLLLILNCSLGFFFGKGGFSWWSWFFSFSPFELCWIFVFLNSSNLSLALFRTSSASISLGWAKLRPCLSQVWLSFSSHSQTSVANLSYSSNHSFCWVLLLVRFLNCSLSLSLSLLMFV